MDWGGLQRPVLVTGASGFLGERLARTLHLLGAQVVGTYFTHSIEIPGTVSVGVDLTDRRAVGRLFRDLRPAGIFHAAAMTKLAECDARPDEAQACNLDATRHIADASREHSPAIPLVFFSTDLVFDGTAAPYRERDAAKPLSRYGSLKLDAEAVVLAAERGTVLRGALMYGPRGTHAGSFLDWILRGLAEGSPVTLFQDEVRTPVHVDDVVNAALVVAGTHGLWHVGGPQRLDRLAMGRAVCAAFDLPETGLVPAALTGTSAASSRPADVSLDSSAFCREFGWQPREFAEGLRQTRDEILQRSA